MYLWTDSIDPVHKSNRKRAQSRRFKSPRKVQHCRIHFIIPVFFLIAQMFCAGTPPPARRTLAVSWLLISCSSPTDRSAVRQPAASEVLLSGDHSITRFVNRPKIECSHVNRAKGQCTGSNPPSVAPNSSSLRPCGPKTPRRRFRDQPGKSNWKCEPGVGAICFYFVGFSKCRQFKRVNDKKDKQ